MILVLALALALAACGQPAPQSASAEELLASAIAATPSDTRLAQLYAASCKTCHTSRDSGAPLTHDRAAWDQRWEQGMDTLVDHTISGFQAMPPGGLCFSCTADDYRNLIAFMAAREDPV
jgi:cytochrome c5